MYFYVHSAHRFPDFLLFFSQIDIIMRFIIKNTPDDFRECFCLRALRLESVSITVKATVAEPVEEFNSEGYPTQGS